MGKLKSSLVTAHGQGTAVLKALADGIEQAGGVPDIELLRIESQENLAKELGELIMSKLLIRGGYLNNFRVSWERTPQQILADNGWKCGLGDPSFFEGIFEEGLTFGKATRYPKAFNYELKAVQRRMSPKEIHDRFLQSQETPVLMEFLEVAEAIQTNTHFTIRTSRQMVLPSLYHARYLPWLDLISREFNVVDCNHSYVERGDMILTY